MTFKPKITIIILIGWLFFLKTPVVHAGYQTCIQGENCSVGEFLYDDNYDPIITASCTLTSRNPDESLHLNNVAMTASSQNDGWYSYAFATTGLNTGTYRSKVCCTTGSDYLCLDKTFIISSPNLTAENIEAAILDAPTSEHETTGSIGEAIVNSGSGGSSLTAADVWSYQNRSLTSFGSLVGDIWGNGTRTLSGFGSLVDNIWDSDERTLTTKAGELTQEDLQDVATELEEHRKLLESIANKPIIETSIEENFVSLDSKLEETVTRTNSFASSLESLRTKIATLQANWQTLSDAQINDNFVELLSLIGDDQADSKTLLADTTWLSQAWDNQLTKDVKSQIETIKTDIKDLKSRTDFYGKSNTTKDIPQLVTRTQTLMVLLGSKNDQPSKASLYGYTNYLVNLNQTITEQEKRVTDLTSVWQKESPTNLDQTLNQIRNKLLGLNVIPQSQVLGVSTNDNPNVTRRNELFNLKALIQTSRNILSQFAGKPVQHIWLEEGSIIFKAVVTNPSSIITQTVPLKFYLPVEIKKENIIELDPALTLNFDPDRNSYYVAGEFTLPPGASRTFRIETTDIWVLDKNLVESYKKQAEQLLEPLKNTAYYAQGATVKADIDVTLDKILASENAFLTPEERIKLHRDTQIDLNGVEQKLVIMQDLVANASSTGSIFGFIGGVQAVAVWGLIIIVVTGFVYLSLYMRALNLQLNRGRGGRGSLNSPTLLELLGGLVKRSNHRSHRLAQFVFLALLSASASAFIGSFYLRATSKPINQTIIKDNLAQAPTPTPNQDGPKDSQTTGQAQVLGLAKTDISYFIVKVAATKPTPVYQSLDPQPQVLANLSQSQVVAKKGEQGNWSQVELLINEELQTGWIETKLLIPEPTN